MSSAMTVQRKLDERYGRNRSPVRRRLGWIIAGALGAAVFGYVAFVTVSGAMNSVDFDTTGFTTVDKHTTEVSFQVVTPPGTAITCALEAQDEEHGVVGWRVVEYPPSDGHTQAFTESIPTLAEATTGLASRCWIP